MDWIISEASMRFLVPLILVVGALAGCGQSKQPPMSHGKPVSHWIATLEDRDPAKRQRAVKALGHVGAADPAAIPAVTEALKDPSARVRAEAALALFNIGPPAKDAMPALQKAQHDQDATVRTYSQQALKRMLDG
jgi:HEAT repeat protein